MICNYTQSVLFLFVKAEQVSYAQLLDYLVIVIMAAIWTFIPSDGIALVTQWFFNKVVQVSGHILHPSTHLHTKYNMFACVKDPGSDVHKRVKWHNYKFFLIILLLKNLYWLYSIKSKDVIDKQTCWQNRNRTVVKTSLIWFLMVDLHFVSSRKHCFIYTTQIKSISNYFGISVRVINNIK